MRSRSRQPSTLSIRPPSPNPQQQASMPSSIHRNLQINTSNQGMISPRKAPLPPSPTQSSVSGASSNYNYDDIRRPRGGSDVGKSGGGGGYELAPPPVPSKASSDKKLPPPPAFFNNSAGPSSPHRRDGQGTSGKGWAVGVYDNKLVSSSLSHLPPLPSLNPAPPSSSTSLASLSTNHTTNSGSRMMPTTNATNYPSPSSTPRPSMSNNPSVVVLPDGTALPSSNSSDLAKDRIADLGGTVRGVRETIAHSRPDSPWSILMIHVLPIFAGSPLKSSIEELNLLCSQHIVATSQRAPTSRLVALLTSDFTDFIGSGMMTLKSKIETLEDGKVVQRLAEIWSFFWAQNLPYLEGIFLPFTQLRDLPSVSTTSIKATTSPNQQSYQSPIPVRHLLLSGFLLHILLPIISRLESLLSRSQKSAVVDNLPPPTASDLQRLLQMALVLSTQAKYSSFYPMRDDADSFQRDEEIRDSVESLGKIVRWRMSEDAAQPARDAANPRYSQLSGTPTQALQRGPSLTQSGRYRRKGWRASTSSMGQAMPLGVGKRDSELIQPNRQNSDYLTAPDQRWGRSKVDEEDEDEGENTPGQQHYVPGKVVNDGNNVGLGLGMGSGLRSEDASYATTNTATGVSSSTLTASTVRGSGVGLGGSLSTTYASNDQHTPLADFGGRTRGDSAGSSDLTPIVQDLRRTGRTQI